MLLEQDLMEENKFVNSASNIFYLEIYVLLGYTQYADNPWQTWWLCKTEALEQVCRMKKKKENRQQDRTCTPGGNWCKGDILALEEVPSLVETTIRTEKDLQKLRGQHNNCSVAGRTEWDLSRGSMPPPYMPKHEHESTCTSRGWVVESGV